MRGRARPRGRWPGRAAVSRRLAVAIVIVGLSLLPAAAADDALDKLVSDLQITPLGDQTPPVFTLEAIDGKKVSLAGLRGRAVFLYFWEST